MGQMLSRSLKRCWSERGGQKDSGSGSLESDAPVIASVRECERAAISLLLAEKLHRRGVYPAPESGLLAMTNEGMNHGLLMATG